jgi:hypothetical protein
VAKRLGAALVVLFIALTSCGAVGGSVTSAQQYTVTASLMQKPGNDPMACNAIPLSFPPPGCGGVAIHGLDMDSVPGVFTYSNGLRATQTTFRLVGTWDGHALTLMRGPVAAPMSAESRISPECQQEPGTVAGGPTPPLMQRVMDDEALLRSKGIQLLEFYACKGTVFLGLAVADPPAVAFLTNRYGYVEIGSWLQPVDD